MLLLLVQSKPTTETDSHDGGETSRKKSRQGFQIDFLEGEDVDEEELFAPDKPARITISTGKEAAVEDKIHVLPDDMHFSSKQLLRLFLKPRSVVNLHSNAQLSPLRFIHPCLH